MSKLMWIAGILLIALGVALGLMVFASPTSIVGWGITPEVTALLVVGGILAIGLGGVVNALDRLPVPQAQMPSYAPPATPIPEFGRRVTEQAAVATDAVAENVVDEVSEPVKETIEALEQARQRLEQAFEPKPEETLGTSAEIVEPVAEPEPEPEKAPDPQPAAVAEPEPAEPDEPEDDGAGEQDHPEGQLYVVEERFIRQRPARILSDGTVEAETDDGWMRFENLEHLDEYLDAMAPAAKG